MHKNKLFWLGCIFIFGLAIRLWGGNSFPPALNWDEVSHGYNARSLLLTGRDEWGIALPTIFRVFGDYKLPVYLYLTVPVSGMPRLPSMVFGALSIVLAGALGYQLTKRTGVMYALAFLVAVEPWTWLFSRIAIEANVSLTLILLGALLWARYKNALGLIGFWGLAMWAYNSARIFVPLGLIAGSLMYRNQAKQAVVRHLLPLLVIFIAIYVPVATQLMGQSGSARFKWTSLLDSGAINQINELRGRSMYGNPIDRLVYNKVTYFVVQSAKSFKSYFSPKYWLQAGGSQYQYTVQGHGIVFWSDALWFIAGLVVLLKHRRLGFIILVWFTLAMIPGSITRDAPHPLRTIYGVLPIFLILALGVDYLVQKFGRKVWAIFLLATLGLFTQYLLVAQDYRTVYSWSWQYGHAQAVDYIRDNLAKYDQVLITKEYGEPHEFLAYYLPIAPDKFQSDLKRWDYHDDWYWVNGFEQFKFVNDWEMLETAKHVEGKRILVICSPKNVVPGAKLTEIKFLNGETAFVLVEI